VKRLDARASLAAGAATVTIALTAAAFWLSYEHLHDVANGNGLDGIRAWAWPATVDLFIVAGELLMLRASLARRGMDWWAVALAASGSLGSIALNVAGVGTDAQPMEYVVAAVPPVAALLAFGALMRQVHQALMRIPTPDAGEPVTVERIPPAPPEAPALAAPQPFPAPSTDAPAIASAFAAGQPASAVRQLVTPGADEELYLAALAINATALAETGRPASLRRLQDGLRIGQKRAQRLQRALAEGA
jgi:hypothetical protein